MKLLFFNEARLLQTSDYRFYSTNQSFSSEMFSRYLKVFESVIVVSRSAIVDNNEGISEITRIDNENISVLPVPFYMGLYQYLLKRSVLKKSVQNIVDSHSDAAFICRVPGVIGTTAIRYLVKKKMVFGVEIVGDPRDVFASGSFKHPFRIVLKYLIENELKFVVKQASAVLYVTKTMLQTRYPTNGNTFNVHASNVILTPECYVSKAKVLTNQKPFSIVSVGTLSVMYKSPDIAIKAIAILKERGFNISFKWIGDGNFLEKMEVLAKKSGLSDAITFVGNIKSSKDVRMYLDNADLFILPSRTEGLPRALLEAMARGLPCIGTNIGGIPELLDEIAMVPINNPRLLADKIEQFLSIPRLADAQAERNLLEARNYSSAILDAKRVQFYEYLSGIS